MTHSFWKRLSLLVAVVATLATADLLQPQALAQKKSDSVVKSTVKAEKPDADGKQVVTITMEVESPWHIYANPVGQDDLADARTVITVGAKTALGAVTIDYPKGKVKEDKVIGNYNIYEGKVTFKATVKRAKDDSSPLTVTLKFQACNDSTCLVPATVKLTTD
jgi:hypothetical protein